MSRMLLNIVLLLCLLVVGCATPTPEVEEVEVTIVVTETEESEVSEPVETAATCGYIKVDQEVASISWQTNAGASRKGSGEATLNFKFSTSAHPGCVIERDTSTDKSVPYVISDPGCKSIKFARSLYRDKDSSDEKFATSGIVQFQECNTGVITIGYDVKAVGAWGEDLAQTATGVVTVTVN